MKNIVILGSTGSIGENALKVVAQFPDRFRIVGLSAGRNSARFRAQIEKFNPKVVAVSDDETYEEMKKFLKGRPSPELLCGSDGISSIAAMTEADIVLSAISGAAGLLPTLAAIRAGKIVALANKETLVMAGPLVMKEVARSGATLLPVDSEHSAIFQCITGKDHTPVRKLILTASGGPFLNKAKEELEQVTAEDALKHPNWSMGKKITIDSASLMNKGLEVIEAHYLFGIPADAIEVLVHPQSIIHSIVEFHDGSYLAQLSRPDMKGPIAFALSYPERLPDIMEPLEWERLSQLTFTKPDAERFPCLALAYEALKANGTLPAVLNAANEVAVTAFLDGAVGFNRIPAIIKQVMDSHTILPADRIEAILEADAWARKMTLKELSR